MGIWDLEREGFCVLGAGDLCTYNSQPTLIPSALGVVPDSKVLGFSSGDTWEIPACDLSSLCLCAKLCTIVKCHPLVGEETRCQKGHLPPSILKVSYDINVWFKAVFSVTRGSLDYHWASPSSSFCVIGESCSG